MALHDHILNQGNGIVRLAPSWVPRSFCIPGRRIKLHPDDYYALGGERGGIDERWFSSTTPADNGPLTGEYEGLSFIVFEEEGRTEKMLLRDAVSDLKGALIGDRIWDEYGRWPIFSKFFDNKGALPHHIHHNNEFAAKVGQLGKPEAYYFPPQVNNYGGDFPFTFFGLEPGTTKEDLIRCLRDFDKGDNKITNIARAYRLEPGTGWDVPPGVLHAPGSLCTYEPQFASDVFSMFQSLTGDQIVSKELLWKDMPEEEIGSTEYLVSMLDWDLNVDPEFVKNRFMKPYPVATVEDMESAGFREHWICYKSSAFSAKELSVLPGRSVTIRDSAAYGMIMMQGHGTMGVWDIETPTMIRFGDLTHDEFFVSENAAKDGVTITNPSKSDPIVMLKHFGPGNPDMPIIVN